MKILFEKILSEGKNLEQTLNKYTDILLKRLSLENTEDNKNFVRNRIQHQIELDPTYRKGSTTTGDYGEWLIKNMLNGNFSDFTVDEITDLLNQFIDKKANLTNKDINTYTPNELEKLLKDVQLTPRQILRRLRNNEDYEQVFSGETFDIFIPKSYKGSCALGSGTSWCTADDRNDNWYNRYTDDGDLYILINKNNPKEKYQFHFASNSFMDSEDFPIDLLPFMEEHSDVKEFFIDKFPHPLFSTEQFEVYQCSSSEELGMLLNFKSNFSIDTTDDFIPGEYYYVITNNHNDSIYFLNFESATLKDQDGDNIDAFDIFASDKMHDYLFTEDNSESLFYAFEPRFQEVKNEEVLEALSKASDEYGEQALFYDDNSLYGEIYYYLFINGVPSVAKLYKDDYMNRTLLEYLYQDDRWSLDEFYDFN